MALPFGRQSFSTLPASCPCIGERESPVPDAQKPSASSLLAAIATPVAVARSRVPARPAWVSVACL